MKPYHPANLKYIDAPSWRIIALAYVGKWLGLQFHIGGIPFGAAYRPSKLTEERASTPSLSNGGA